jgi:CTP:molybdopterin cytidylyltransferase MocA
MQGSRKIAATILAAGYSSPMGAFKPLLRLGEYTAVEFEGRCA